MSIYYFDNAPHGKRADGSKLNTKLHYDYIAREGKYEKEKSGREDLVHLSSGNLPEWAETGADFWQEAENHRRKNGRSYREFKIGLQEELTLEENKELIERFLKQTGIADRHVYSYAIHDKAAAFDTSHRNIHCHLMFSEKVLEKDRPLPPEKFFKNYAENEHGEPTQGYLTDPYWAKKETTLELREKWAALVNEKFAEKGLDCRIDHRTLDVQREDLIAQGKLEEAQLLDRTPAPHLGKAYKNPKTMEKIMMAIEKEDRISDAPNADDSGDVSDRSKETEEELKIAIFANDVMLRKIAREIQSERARLQNEYKEERDAQEAANILDEPYAVTVEDIANYCAKKEAVYRKLADRELARYNRLRKAADEGQIRAAAIDRIFNGTYRKAMRDYAAATKALETANKKVRAAQERKDHAAALATMRDVNQLNMQRGVLGKQIAAFKKEMQTPEFAQKLEAHIQKIKDTLPPENVIAQLHRKHTAAHKEAERYAAMREALAPIERDRVLFADKLPKALTRHSRIDGETPVGKLPMKAFDGDTYAILSRMPKEGRIVTLEAVKIGDDIRRGSVQKHLVMYDRDKKRIISSTPAYDTAGKPERVRLYRTKNRRNTGSSKQTNDAHKQRAKNINEKVSALAKKMLHEREKNCKIVLRWNEEELKDKAIRAEERMYQDWGR